MRKEAEWHLKERYQQLKEELTDQSYYPYVNNILNLPLFIKEVPMMSSVE